MEKVTVIFGRTENNYSACIEGLDGFVCTADTFDELKTEVSEGLKFHIEGIREENYPIPAMFQSEYEFTYRWDVECLMWYYGHVITSSALSRFTGINERQLGHYATGRSKPRPAQIKKIEAALHRLGKELQSVSL